MNRPSDRAIAQAFWEERNDPGAHGEGLQALEEVEDRAREIDAAAPDGAQAVAWSDEDRDRLIHLREGLDRICGGTTAVQGRNFICQPKGARKMTIRDAQEFARQFLPFVSDLISRASTTPPQPQDAPPSQDAGRDTEVKS